MMVYLSDLSPDGRLLPGIHAVARGQALRWQFFLASEIYPAVLNAYDPENFIDGDSAQQNLAAKATNTLDRLSALFTAETLSRLMFTSGDQLTAVDIYVAKR